MLEIKPTTEHEIIQLMLKSAVGNYEDKHQLLVRLRSIIDETRKLPSHINLPYVVNLAMKNGWIRSDGKRGYNIQLTTTVGMIQ